MQSRTLSAMSWRLPHPGVRRGAMLFTIALTLVAYTVLIYGEVLTGTAAYWCSDIVWTLFSLIAALRCFATARRQEVLHQRRAWMFFGAAALSWFIGMLLWDYQELILGRYAPYPSVADYFFNGFAPFFVAGVFYYRSEKPTAEFTLKQAGNLGMIFSAVAVVFMIVFVGPIVAADRSMEFLVLSILHATLPVTALLFALTVLWLHVWGGMRRVYALLVTGMGLHAGTDILYNYAQLGESFGATNYLNIYWLIAFALQYWAAWEQANLSETQREAVVDDRGASRTRGLEALIPAVLVSGMVIVGWIFRDELTSQTVVTVIPAIIVFAIFLGLREWWNDRYEAGLTEQLRSSNKALERVNLDLSRDVAERKQAEKALRESEERFRNLIEGSVQGIYIHSDFKPLFVNRAFAEILGYASADELLATINSIENHHAPHERDRIRGYKEARLKGEDAPVRYEYEALRKDGSIVTLQNAVRVINWEGMPAIQSTVIDISEARNLSEQLSFQASHDPLTGLLNRRAFEQRLQHLLERAQTENSEHVLCYLDLDQFKVINDNCGHTAGDELLRQLAQVLQQQVRGPDTLARLGGDEFGLLLECCSVAQAQRVTAAVQKAVESFRFAWEEKSFNVGVSIGVVPINQASERMEGMLSMADAACYAAKDAGRNRVHVYREDDAELAKRRGEMHWVAEINRAFEDGRFLLHCQSFIPLAEGNDQRPGYELLVRMQHDNDRVVVPGAFLPAAERYNLSTRLDRWVVGSAFQWFSRHRQVLERLFICSINLSGSSLGDNEFLEFVIEQFKTNNVPPEKFCFEITETAAIANLTHATRFIASLKRLGCRFALDDFGSGLSSFAYLKNLPVDYLKIDGMFVKDIVDDPIHLAMVKSINEMGHVMGKQTIAEFVENDAVLEKLREIGVDYAQGYGIDRPRPLEDIIEHAGTKTMNVAVGRAASAGGPM